VDNMGVSRILKVSSSKPHLQKDAVDIFRLRFALGISLDSQWLPREENLRADLLSRFIDRGAWIPLFFYFWMLDRVLIPWIVFHLTSIRKLLDLIRGIFRWVAPRWCFGPGLGSDNNWLCLPVYLIIASVKHLCCHKGVGTLVIPEWPSAAFGLSCTVLPLILRPLLRSL